MRSASRALRAARRRRRRPHDGRDPRRLGVRLLAGPPKPAGGGTLTLRDRRAHPHRRQRARHGAATAVGLRQPRRHHPRARSSPPGTSTTRCSSSLRCTATGTSVRLRHETPTLRRRGLRLSRAGTAASAAAAATTRDAPPMGARFQLAMSDAQIEALPCPPGRRRSSPRSRTTAATSATPAAPASAAVRVEHDVHVVRLRRPARRVRARTSSRLERRATRSTSPAASTGRNTCAS